MKQILLGRDGVSVAEVPAPGADAGTVLVRSMFSCISTGTELSGLQSISKPVWQRAIEQPEHIQRLLSVVREQGLAQSRAAVRAKLASLNPIGYSLAGEVIGVGEGVTHLALGEQVACAGGQCAFHAEVVRVPVNLVAPVPADVSLEAASTVAIGAIAVQGVRRAEPTLGERIVVIGLGLLGQLTVQILKANGCEVFGTDIDSSRVDIAVSTGLAGAANADEVDPVAAVERWTGGEGADAVIVTAASSSEELLNSAFRMCRRKGRVVLVGEVPMRLDRIHMYAKELDFRISTSYGPGRYDPSYEEGGADYPLPYVRWTAGRNMQTYLSLLASKAVVVEPFIDKHVPIDRAPEAYEAMKSAARPVMTLLTYPNAGAAPVGRRVEVRAGPRVEGGVRVAIVGPGAFFKSTLLPIVQSLNDMYAVRAVVARSGHVAYGVASLTQAGYASTSLNDVLADPEIDLLMVATRHDLHADTVVRALRAGKAIFVEKPLAISRQQLAEVEAVFAEAEADCRPTPLLLTGFNRRFSPHLQFIAGALANRQGPVLINYRVNAGRLPADSWVHGPEGGGRNLGEACHFYDTMSFLTQAEVKRVDACALGAQDTGIRRNENFVATVAFAEGSVATLTYTAQGSADHPKERMEVYCDGQVFDLDDFKTLKVVGRRDRRGKVPQFSIPNKGHKHELVALGNALKSGGDWPIPLWQQLQATAIALEVEERINSPE